MSHYHIIDEPKPKRHERFIVDPLGIFFVSVFVPLFWMPPLLGKFWIPIIWLLANSYLLGSPTFRKEIVIAVLGCLSFVGVWLSIGFITQNKEQLTTIVPYIKVLTQAVFFFTLYMIVFQQAGSFAIHEYVKEQGKAE